MEQKAFLHNLQKIKLRLYNLEPSFDRKKGFVMFLKHLKSNNILPESTINNIYALWQLRNKIYNSPTNVEIMEDSTNRISEINTVLNRN